MMTFVSYKYRLYPNKTQKEYFSKVFGCVRFIYNKMLEDCDRYYEICGRMLPTNPSSYKDQYPFLREVDSSALSNAKMNLDKAYRNYFHKRAEHPKFKSRKDNHFSYTTNYLHDNIRIEGSYIRLPKIKMVKAKFHRKFEGVIKSATVTMTPAKEYYVSLLVETEIKKLPPAERSIGIDLGVLNIVTDSDGKKIPGNKTSDKYAKRLAKEQRNLARKEKGSKNREKQRVKLARVYRKIVSVRNDFLHKISKKIVDENQVISCEDLVIADILKGNHFARDIADASWSSLIRMIKYKAEWYGRDFIQVGKYFPSSQICSRCWYKNDDIKNISVKEWTCPDCDTVHDRDINAAKNILAEGKRLLSVKEMYKQDGLECPDEIQSDIGESWIDNRRTEKSELINVEI